MPSRTALVRGSSAPYRGTQAACGVPLGFGHLNLGGPWSRNWNDLHQSVSARHVLQKTSGEWANAFSVPPRPHSPRSGLLAGLAQQWLRPLHCCRPARLCCSSSIMPSAKGAEDAHIHRCVFDAAYCYRLTVQPLPSPLQARRLVPIARPARADASPFRRRLPLAVRMEQERDCVSKTYASTSTFAYKRPDWPA